MSPKNALKPMSALIPSLLVIASLAACTRVGAQVVAAAAPPSIRIGVAGSCPAGAGPMRPGSGGGMDLNGDGYVCTLHFRSMDGDTIRITVDNDVLETVSVQAEPYIGM